MNTWTKAIIGMGLVVGLAAPALAFPGGGDRCDKGVHGEKGMQSGRHMDRMAKALNLTDEQQEKIRDIHKQGRDQFKDLGERMRDNRKAMRQLDPLDSHYDADVKKLAREQGQLVEKMIVLHSRERAQVDRILTPEQREQARKLMQERHDRMQQHRRDGKGYGNKGDGSYGNGPQGDHRRQGPDHMM